MEKNQQPEIKPQMVFDEIQNEQAPSAVLPEIEHLQDKMVFGEDEVIQQAVVTAEQIEQIGKSDVVTADKALKPAARKWSLSAKLLGAVVSVILGIETVGFFADLWQNQPLMAGLYGGALALVLGIGAKFTLAEYRHLQRLKRLQQWHNASQRMDSGEQIGEALSLCKAINKQLPDDADIHQAIGQWQGALKDTFTDKDVMALYSHTVIDKIDEKALAVISRYAGETSLMVAISPLAVMDMMLVLWRSIKMIEQICTLYGVRLGYWSRLRLIKIVLGNVVYAGVSELVADVGAAALSLELAGKLSSRAAQGVGAGLLTGRLGFKVMQLCRPIPALPNKKKRLGDLSRHLLGHLRQALVGNKSSKKEP